ncbi:hypothetical protein C8J57DRAFT_1048823, partial [Mycena rebaudengoi]
VVTDYYAVLAISSHVARDEIKSAYHRALLRSHPDKVIVDARGDAPFDIALIQEAYHVLSTPALREQHDLNLRRSKSAATGPRPAALISLEDFDFLDSGSPNTPDLWEHSCRCGGMYRITSDDMDAGRHLVGCTSCSEVVWVGYEVACEEE